VSPSLSVVTKGDPPKAETVAERIRRLQAEARTLARNHVKALSAAMGDVALLATEIADGGDAYPPGIRDLARRLCEELETRGQTLDAISNRT
jgi:hypothetical protein